MDICTNIMFLRILSYLQITLKIMRFVVPIILILKIGFDLYKSMLSGDANLQKETTQKAFKRVIAAVIVFLIPTVVEGLVSIIEYAVGGQENYQDCIVNISNIEYYEDLKETEEELKEQLAREEALNKFSESQKELSQLLENNLKTMAAGTEDGQFLGQKYNLTESQLKNIAKVCQREQGNAEGAAKEASLMANKYELLSNSSKYKNRGIYSYVMNCGWWAPANNGTYSSVKLSASVLEAVRKVLVDGQRVLPLYIDTHDWYGDITKITVNGKSYTGKDNFRNRSLFIKDKTQVLTKYSSSSADYWIYYVHAHAGKNADPFGYYPKSKKKVEAMNAK